MSVLILNLIQELTLPNSRILKKPPPGIKKKKEIIYFKRKTENRIKEKWGSQPHTDYQKAVGSYPQNQDLLISNFIYYLLVSLKQAKPPYHSLSIL